MRHPRTLTSVQHPLVKHFVKLRTDSSYREECQTIILEGWKPIQELASLLKTVLYTSSYASSVHALAAEKWQVTEAIVHKLSGVLSPEGIIAEIDMPTFHSLPQSPSVLALDGINDPGNLGTLLRTALALGWKTIYFLPGGCDPFNDKALRAGRGAHFKLTLAKGSANTLRQWVQAEQCQALVAEIQGIPLHTVPPACKRLLVLGNEAQGPSQEIRQFCQSVTVPMPGGMESLNVAVAGGILLYFLQAI